MSSMRGLLCRFSVVSCSSRPGPVLQKCSSVLVRPQESPWRPTCSVREASQRMWDREEKSQGTRAQRDEGRARERYPSDVRTTRFKTRPREQGFGVGLKPFAFGELSGGGDPSASADHIHEEDEVSERPAQIRPPHKYHKKIVHLLKEQKNLKAALSVLDEMKEDGKEPDRSTLSLLMGGCSQFGYLDKCLELFKQLMETEVRRPPPSAYTSLFNACANSFDKESALVAAKRIQRDMEVRLYIPNRPIFHAMIKAYSRCGDLHGALGVVDLMVGAEHGLQPTDETFNFLFQGCVEDKGEGFRHALMIWRKMRQMGIRPSVYSYNLFLRVVRDCKAGEKGEDGSYNDLLQELLTKPIEDRITRRYGSVLIKGRQPRDMIDVDPMAPPAILPEKNKEEVSTSVVVPPPAIVLKASQEASSGVEYTFETEKGLIQSTAGTSLPDVLGPQHPEPGAVVALGSLEYRQERLAFLGGTKTILAQMKRDGATPDIKTFSTLLASVPQSSEDEWALIEMMRKYSLKPDTDFLNQLVKKQALRGDNKSAWMTIEMLAHYGLTPDILTFGCVALGCRKSEDVRHLLKDMKEAGFSLNSAIATSLLVHASKTRNYGMANFMIDAIHKNLPEVDLRLVDQLERLRESAMEDKLIPESEWTLPGKRSDCMHFIFGYEENLKQIKVMRPSHPWSQFKTKKELEEDEEGNALQETKEEIRRLRKERRKAIEEK